MSEIESSTAACIERIREILGTARAQALQTVNVTMVSAYWHIGREIVEEEQRGKARADYGSQLMSQLSERLTREFGKGFSVANLRFIRQFYLTYHERDPQIRYSVSSELPEGQELDPKQYSVSSEFISESSEAFRQELSWTHYRVLMRVTPPEARAFYEVEAVKSHWSVRELERQIGSLLFERLSKSRDKKGVMALAKEDHEVFASRYQLHLPSEEDLAEELMQERTRLEQQLLGDGDDEHPGE